MEHRRTLAFHIFCLSFFASFSLYVAAIIILVAASYNSLKDQIFYEMERSAKIFASLPYEDMLAAIGQNNYMDSRRVSLIQPDGTVYYDNTVAISQLDNHSSRPEIRKALNGSSSRETRYSSTLRKHYQYYARRLYNGHVLRISRNTPSFLFLLPRIYGSLLIVFILAIVLFVCISFYLSRKITEPINRIDLDDPEKDLIYEEFKPLARRLAQGNLEIRQREELRQQFSANVSHELRTPLTSINGFSEILMCKEKDEQLRDFACTIHDESQRLMTMVNNLIHLSRIDEDALFNEKEEFSLSDTVEQILASLEPIARKRGIECTFSGGCCEVFGVYQIIYEIIYNIIDNAIKYNKEHGKVHITLNETDERIVLAIKDTGIGISEDEQTRIFERFYRVDKSRSKLHGGTGLGLSIVKHGASTQNISVKVDSELGVGTTFSLVFNKSDRD